MTGDRFRHSINKTEKEPLTNNKMIQFHILINEQGSTNFNMKERKPKLKQNFNFGQNFKLIWTLMISIP